MIRSIINLWHDEDAVTTVEYALLLSTVAIAGIGAWTALGEGVRNAVSEAATQLETAGQ